jgi:ubiquinol-cytochrome c reductase cytochrome c subunit
MTKKTPPSAAGSAGKARQRLAKHTKFRRRMAGMLALAVALIAVGALYSAFAPSPQTAQAADQSATLRKGEEIFNKTCISCHGANLQGVKDRGPSLNGVGSSAVYFQTSTGRMPAMGQSAQEARKQPALKPDEIDALMAYIESKGGGPEAPNKEGDALRGSDTARGGQLFRLNCASCHNFTGRGGALSSGKYAPELDGVSEKQMYTAMQSGPENMPKFSDRQLTPTEKQDIIGYIKSVTDGNNNPGGDSLGGFGPVSEGLIIWVIGVGALLGVTLWIGGKA